MPGKLVRMAADHSVIAATPEGDEFVVEAWRPSWEHGFGLLGAVATGIWSLISPGWRINVKRLPVRGGRALYRERARSEHEALDRLGALADAVRQGRPPWP